MARMSAVLEKLQQRLVAKYADPAKPITFVFGDLTPHGAPPRIVWMPSDVRHLPADQTTSKTQARRLLTRVVPIVAHCWGADYDATEQLVHDLIACAYADNWGSVDFLGEQWNTGNNQDFGAAALVTFAISIPIERAALRTTTFGRFQFDATGAAPGDGEIEAGES